MLLITELLKIIDEPHIDGDRFTGYTVLINDVAYATVVERPSKELIKKLAIIASYAGRPKKVDQPKQ